MCIRKYGKYGFGYEERLHRLAQHWHWHLHKYAHITIAFMVVISFQTINFNENVRLEIRNWIFVSKRNLQCALRTQFKWLEHILYVLPSEICESMHIEWAKSYFNQVEWKKLPKIQLSKCFASPNWRDFTWHSNVCGKIHTYMYMVEFCLVFRGAGHR